jgi:aminoglycoside phosphotransferase family enzyme/predicted kinase
MGELQADLSQGAELIETHVSWVFRHASTVLKVKKPVDLGFLDFTSVEKRRVACERELELNRRLTRDVYIRVVPITRGSDGLHCVEGDGDVVDYGVLMRRLPDATRADHLLAVGKLGLARIRRIARSIADFHATAARGPEVDRAGSVEVVGFNVRENFEQSRALAIQYITKEQERTLERHQLDFLRDNSDLLARRVAEGRICDGHGDLRLEHVYLTNDSLNIIDCIEFNERFRHGDVCADIAFLAMDIAHQNRSDLSEAFLAAYARATGDYDLYALVDFYQAYRATVRAKVTSFLAAAPEASFDARESAKATARGYYLQAMLAQQRESKTNWIIAVGGPIASGKSVTSEHLADRLFCPIVDTDRTRKQLLGLSEEQPVHDAAFSGAYTPEATARIYEEVTRRAGVVLESGRSVVVDASFRTAESRTRLRHLATRCGAQIHFVQCEVPRDVALKRLAERAQGPSVSDGRREIYDEFLASWEPATELPAKLISTLDTSAPQRVLDAHLDEIVSRLTQSA